VQLLDHRGFDRVEREETVGGRWEMGGGRKGFPNYKVVFLLLIMNQ
jgi:hypothetical protein